MKTTRQRTTRRARLAAVLVAAAVTATTALFVANAESSSAAGCNFEQWLVFSENARSVDASRERVCGDRTIPITTTIRRNGVTVASGAGSAAYDCQGYGDRAAVFTLYGANVPPVSAFCE